jgi:hypothetical protein
MKRILAYIVLAFWLIGCDHATEPSVYYFPPFDVSGEWVLVFEETEVQWRMTLEHTDAMTIRGRIQPDTTLQEYMEVGGILYPGIPGFGFHGYSWNYLHDFDCRISPSMQSFAAQMRLFSRSTNLQAGPTNGWRVYGVKQ